MSYFKKNWIYFLSLFLITTWVLYGTYWMFGLGPWTYGSIPANMMEIVSSDRLVFYIPLSSLFVIVPAVLEYVKDFRSQNIKNKLNRMTYKEYIKEKKKSTYKYGLIFMMPVIIMFIGACIADGGIDLGKKVNLTMDVYVNGYVFIVIYFILNYFYGVFYAKLSFWTARKNRSIIITIVMTFFLNFFLEFGGEMLGIFVRNLVKDLFGFKITTYTFGVWSQFQMHGINVYIFAVYSIFLFILMNVLLYCAYKSEEKLLIECER